MLLVVREIPLVTASIVAQPARDSDSVRTRIIFRTLNSFCSVFDLLLSRWGWGYFIHSRINSDGCQCLVGSSIDVDLFNARHRQDILNKLTLAGEYSASRIQKKIKDTKYCHDL